MKLDDELPWIVCENGIHDWKCQRCGGSYFPKIAEGQPLWVYQALLEGFIKNHKNCGMDIFENEE